MQRKEFSTNGSDVDLTGIKIGLVVDNMDQKGIERVKVRVLGIHDMNNTKVANGIWVNHCAPSKYVSGHVPDVGDWVYVQFMSDNDPMSAIWIGFVRGMGQNPNHAVD